MSGSLCLCVCVCVLACLNTVCASRDMEAQKMVSGVAELLVLQ